MCANTSACPTACWFLTSPLAPCHRSAGKGGGERLAHARGRHDVQQLRRHRCGWGLSVNQRVPAGVWAAFGPPLVHGRLLARSPADLPVGRSVGAPLTPSLACSGVCAEQAAGGAGRLRQPAHRSGGGEGCSAREYMVCIQPGFTQSYTRSSSGFNSMAACASHDACSQTHHAPAQVRYDPDATGPRHLLAAVQAVGFTAEPFAEQRLGGWHSGALVMWQGMCAAWLLPAQHRGAPVDCRRQSQYNTTTT